MGKFAPDARAALVAKARAERSAAEAGKSLAKRLAAKVTHPLQEFLAKREERLREGNDAKRVIRATRDLPTDRGGLQE